MQFAIKKTPYRQRRHSLSRGSDSSNDHLYRKLITWGVVAIISLGLLFLLYKVVSFYKSIQINGKDTKTVTKEDKKVEKTEYTALIAGYGGANHEGAYLTDTLILAHVNTKTNKVILINIPRDLWVQVPSESGQDNYSKVNAVYQMSVFPDNYPDIPKKYQDEDNPTALVKETVQTITGLPVDYFVGIDFKGYKQVIDTIGGLDVEVQKTFDDYEYPLEGKEDELCGKEEDFKKVEPYLNWKGEEKEKEEFFKDKKELEEFYKNITENPALAFPCRYEHLHFDKGMTHMDGETALKYARSRHSLQDGNDFGRSMRQQQVIQAIKEKVMSIGFLPKVIPLMDDLKDDIKTDISITELQKFMGEAGDADNYQISTYVISNDNLLEDSNSADGQYILVPREGDNVWTGIHKGLKNVILGITPTLTPSPTPLVSSTPSVKKATSIPEKE